MRLGDPTISTVLCGSSNTALDTYPEWDRVALEACWDHVDYLAMHYYASNEPEDTARYLGLAAQFESHVDTLAGTLRYVKSKLRSSHDVYLSWDEWNVWYKNQDVDGRWAHAPRLLEEVYNLEDALVVAQWLNVFLRRCDVLRIACLAQLVNVIAPIVTTTDSLVTQTIYYPLMLMSRVARGRSLDASTRAPMVPAGQFGELPALDVSASHDPTTGGMGVFVVNRSQTQALSTRIVWQNDRPAELTGVYRVTGDDLKARNSFEHPDAVTAREVSGLRIDDGELSLEIPPLSFTSIAAR
jgi:alpha-N-arabinofuranosidase